MNNVEIEGGLGKDPDFGFTGSGRAWCRFTLAVSDIEWSGAEKREVISTTWIGCQAWGYIAEELMREDPKKGEKLYVRGKLTQSEYEDKDGKTVRKTRVGVTSFQFTNRKFREPAESALV